VATLKPLRLVRYRKNSKGWCWDDRCWHYFHTTFSERQSRVAKFPMGNHSQGLGKAKGTVHPITGHEGTWGEWRYSSTLSLTSVLGGVGGQSQAPSALPQKNQVPIVQEGRWAPGPVWTGAENLAPTGIRFPDRQARSESLYRLSYRGPSQG
jgi:hypothetical protein